MAVTVGFEPILSEITTPALDCIRSRNRDFPRDRVLKFYLRLPQLRFIFLTRLLTVDGDCEEVRQATSTLSSHGRKAVRQFSSGGPG